MKFLVSIALVGALALSISGQTQQLLVQNPEFDRTIRQYLEFSVPTISCQELEQIKEDVILLDAREKKEYEVSHIKGARHIGYRRINGELLDTLGKGQRIVVYCSIGYRSEKVGEQLQELGFSNVSNLYGSIFEWVNQELPIVDQDDNPTKKLHTYNRSWSRWVEREGVEKEW